MASMIRALASETLPSYAWLNWYSHHTERTNFRGSLAGEKVQITWPENSAELPSAHYLTRSATAENWGWVRVQSTASERDSQ